ncbi:MAG TPA: proton-conducting transporter membrane subunit [Lacunisphaera sp.]|nr:proton-conducting transporter membrane subunit [Lacunisphaera sp.]
MNIILALILVPLVAGIGMLLLRDETARRILAGGALLAVAALCGALAWAPAPNGAVTLPADPHAISRGLLVAGSAISLYLLVLGWRRRDALLVLLVLAQAGVTTWFELGPGARVPAAQPLFVDRFAVIMGLINGLVGGGICLYALGYMREYHEAAHRDVPDRRPLFFALLFGFLGAMFGLVFANHLGWLLFFWELTTLCSFLLIGYTQTEEARRNARQALVMNLSGGVAFAAAIAWLYRQTGVVELQAMLAAPHRAIVLLPAALLCFAGITKSAQLPFSSWLLGAMVAPTPVSALLHSSTMVKAGVYLVLRMAPLIAGTGTGLMVALVGAVTFVVASFAAITLRDAKRVLAWSTVANLGLVVLCGGIGSAEAVWAGVLLIVFHAVAKGLLFLCVGVVEHKLHSRDIEAMAGLVQRMPRVAVLMQVGMAGMFLAPFGMLISKWAVLKAVVDASPVLSVFIVFGSAATLFFWVKWMGKLLEVVTPAEPVAREVDAGEAFALYGLGLATFLACLLFPLISSRLIVPYVTGVFGPTGALMGQGNVIIMVAMMSLVLLFPVAFLDPGRGVRSAGAYLGGANVAGGMQFRGLAGTVQDVAIENYYLRGILSEDWLASRGVAAATFLLAVMLILAHP